MARIRGVLGASRFQRTCDPSAPSIYSERREWEISALLERRSGGAQSADGGETKHENF